MYTLFNFQTIYLIYILIIVRILQSPIYSSWGSCNT